jgi:transcriptional regulator with XRE-family HTH domain
VKAEGTAIINDIRVLFGRRVRATRTGRGLSQEALAFECGLHRTYISDIERGNRNISIANVAKIASALKVPVAELFDFSHLPSEGGAGR